MTRDNTVRSVNIRIIYSKSSHQFFLSFEMALSKCFQLLYILICLCGISQIVWRDQFHRLICDSIQLGGNSILSSCFQKPASGHGFFTSSL